MPDYHRDDGQAPCDEAGRPPTGPGDSRPRRDGGAEMRSAIVLAGRTDTPRVASGPTAEGTVRDAVERLSPAVDDVVVSCPADRADAVEAELGGTEYRLATDRVPDGGPVAAIRSGCRVARGRRACVTTPQSAADPALVTALFEAADRDGAIARLEGRDCPLVAVYDTEAAIEAAETTLGMGSQAMTHVLERLDVTVVGDPAPARASEDTDQSAGSS